LIVSQNLTKYDMTFPDDVILRINLAWINNLDELKEILIKYSHNDIFLDLPTKRLKPPSNKYTMDELVPIIRENKNIKYFAVSNVEHPDDISKIKSKLPPNVIIVPKIESIPAIHNIDNIVNSLGENRIIMLDHDDLYSCILKGGHPSEKLRDYIEHLEKFCNNNNTILLKTRGVIFSCK